jgi:flagellar motility protein MotE (MotC chaperone)
MTTTRGIGLGALVLGASVLGGWWSSRAAAPETVHQPATGGADDDRPHKLRDEVHRRSVELDQRDRALAERAAALESLEQAVDDALGDLESRGGTGARAAGPCKLRGGVARIYENMRPEEAAQILDQLDDETLRTVFARMEAKQIAAIVAAMSRERAVAFTKTLAADPEPAAARAPTGRP